MKTGLVLAGGGAKGSFQAEVVRLLEEKGFEWDAIAGVSTGALNGSVIAQEKTESLKDVWDRTRREDVWNTSLLRYLKVATGFKNGLYDPQPLLDTLREVFDPNKVEIPFKSGAVNIENGEYVEQKIEPSQSFGPKQVEKARRQVLASSAIPVFVEPVWVSEERPQMVDGGVRNITPIKDVIEMGELDRIVVVVNSILERDRGRARPDNVIDIVGSTITTLLGEIFREDVSQALRINEVVRECGNVESLKTYDIEVVEPCKPIGSSRNFSIEAARSRRRVARKTMEKF